MDDNARLALWVVGCIFFPPLALIPIYRWWKSRKLSQGPPFQLGLHHSKAGRHAEALQAFQRVEKGDPDYVRAQLLAGECFMRDSDYQTAAEVLKRATLKGNGPSPDEEKAARYWLGRCYQKTGHTGAAEQEYRRVYSVDSQYRDVAQRLRQLTA